MTGPDERRSRRAFVSDAGRLASAAALTACVPPRTATATTVPAAQKPSGQWDLSWVDRIGTATDRAVFDWPSVGDPATT